MADKYLRNSAGDLAEREALTTSAGAGSAGAIIALGSDGRLDQSMLPTGIGADTALLPATEALAAGDLVNVYNVTGTASVRKADASSAGKPAHGFVLSAVASNANATVYFEGTDGQVSGLTPGEVYLSPTTPGRATSAVPTGSGQVVQKVGFATAATSLNFESRPPIILA